MIPNLPNILPPLNWLDDPMIEEGDNGIYSIWVAVYLTRAGYWRWSAALAPYVTVVRDDGTTGEELGRRRASGDRTATSRAEAVAAASSWLRRVYLDAAGLEHTNIKDDQ